MKPARAVLACTLLSALLAACADKGGMTTTGGESGTSTGPGSTSTSTGEDPTESIATVTGAEASGTTAGCGPNTCGPCPEQCTAQDECVDGTWVCECLECGATGSSTGDTGGAEIQCTAEPQVFPSFDRTCAASEDCSVVFHQVDCCGTQVAWGLSADVAKAFAEAEAECVMQFPPCDCAPMPTVTDDGQMVADVAAIMVECQDEMCRSFLP